MWLKLSSGMFVPHGGDAGAFSFEQDEMSVPGQSRPNVAVGTMSGLLQLATKLRTFMVVRFLHNRRHGVAKEAAN